MRHAMVDHEAMAVGNRTAMPTTKKAVTQGVRIGDGFFALCKCLCPEGRADVPPASVNERLTAPTVRL